MSSDETMTRFFQRWVLGMETRALAIMLLALQFIVYPSSGMAANAQLTATLQKKPYRFGVVPQFGQRKLYKVWLPLLLRLEKETGLKFELTGSEQIPVFEKRFEAGEFDFAYMNPYHIVRANNKQGYVPLIRDGSRKLQGLIVVRKDSPIHSVKDLNGKQVAFPSASALGASLLPRAELKRKYRVKIVPRYVKTHTSVYLHVVQNLVVAGGGVKSTLDLQKSSVRKLLKVLYVTDTVNPHPIVAHPRVPKSHMLLVQKALLKISQEPEGSKMLKQIPMYHAVKARLSDYNSVRNLRLDKIK